jgi:hypothetical protein
VGEIKDQPQRQPFAAWNGTLNVLDLQRRPTQSQSNSNSNSNSNTNTNRNRTAAATAASYNPMFNLNTQPVPNSTAAEYYNSETHMKAMDQEDPNPNSPAPLYLTRSYRRIQPPDTSYNKDIGSYHIERMSLSSIIYDDM